jgi:hypothetical protein
VCPKNIESNKIPNDHRTDANHYTTDAFPWNIIILYCGRVIFDSLSNIVVSKFIFTVDLFLH